MSLLLKELLPKSEKFQIYLPYYTAKAEMEIACRQPKEALKTLANAKKLNLSEVLQSVLDKKIGTILK